MGAPPHARGFAKVKKVIQVLETHNIGFLHRMFWPKVTLSFILRQESSSQKSFGDRTRQNGLQNNWLLRAYMANIKKIKNTYHAF